jgi:polar amino acid transport system substrate-binding protein
MRRFAPAAAGLLIAGLLAGCGGGSGTTSAPGPSLAPPMPVGVKDPAPTPSTAAAGTTSCDVRHSSLRPEPGNPASGPTLDKIKARGRLIVGVDQTTYQFGYRDAKTGQIVGFDSDIVRQVAKDLLGNPDAIQFRAVTSAQRIPVIQNHEVDLVAHTMTINCDRLKQVDFSSVYFDAGQRVLVPSTSTVTGIQDLGGKKVCAAEGSTSIVNIGKAPSHPIAVSVADWADCLVLLQQGQVAAISTDDTILQGMVAQDPDNLKLVGPKFTDEPYGLAVNKDANDLLRFVNGVLERIRSDGTWKSLYRQWVSVDVPDPPPAGYRD